MRNLLRNEGWSLRRRRPSPGKRGASYLAASLVVLVLLNGSAQSFSGEPAKKFLIASDLHFNPFADPTLVAELAAAPATQWEGILNRSKLTAYSQYGEDTNWWLLRSALDAMRATLPHPALIMITGDLLAHGFPQKYATATHDSDREHYRTFVLKTVAFIGWELRKRFHRSQILMTPGNNDDECGDYDIQADGPFLNDTEGLVRNLARAGDRVTVDWKTLGSYTIQPQAIRGIRIISLNTVFFSHEYQAASFANACSAVDSSAASRTFTWLEANLAQAREAQQKVWLMFHIPPGIDGYATMMKYRQLSQGASPSEQLCRNALVPMWNPAFTARFESIMEDYQSTITASFAGHNHTDDFRVVNAEGSRPGFVLLDPPFSPIYGQNPAFRVVTLGADGSLADQSTYYLTNLKAARSEVPGEWTREYDFAGEWQSRQLDATSLKDIYARIKNDPEARAQWLRLLNVSSSDDPVPANGVQALDCAIAALDPTRYQTCYCPVAPPSSSPAQIP
jgi:sphingomyelin phosphodiesterase acid-like 3